MLIVVMCCVGFMLALAEFVVAVSLAAVAVYADRTAPALGAGAVGTTAAIIAWALVDTASHHRRGLA